jgi:hypothetical protein
MTGEGKSVSSEELQAARDEAERRIAARDERAARRAAHEEQVGRFRAHIQAAIDEQAAAFPRSEDREPHPLEQQVSEALVTLLLACSPPPEVDDVAVGPPTLSELETVQLDELEAVQQRLDRVGCKDLAEQLRTLCDSARTTGTVDASALAKCNLRILEAIAWERADRAAPPPAMGPPTLPELEALLRSALSALQTVHDPQRRAGYEVVVEQLRALCDAARTTGTVDESALTECDPRIGDALKRERADRAEQEAWQMAPSRRAQPGETVEALTARVLVERGCTPFEAIRVATGKSSDEARDSPIRKRVERAVKIQTKLAAPPEDEEPSPEAIAELERAMEESLRRSR